MPKLREPAVALTWAFRRPAAQRAGSPVSATIRVRGVFGVDGRRSGSAPPCGPRSGRGAGPVDAGLEIRGVPAPIPFDQLGPRPVVPGDAALDTMRCRTSSRTRRTDCRPTWRSRSRPLHRPRWDGWRRGGCCPGSRSSDRTSGSPCRAARPARARRGTGRRRPESTTSGAGPAAANTSPDHLPAERNHHLAGAIRRGRDCHVRRPGIGGDELATSDGGKGARCIDSLSVVGCGRRGSAAVPLTGRDHTVPEAESAVDSRLGLVG